MSSRSAATATMFAFLTAPTSYLIAATIPATVVRGHTFDTTSGSPFRPSQTRKNVSVTPQFLMSVKTLIQNFAPGPGPQTEDVSLTL